MLKGSVHFEELLSKRGFTDKEKLLRYMVYCKATHDCTGPCVGKLWVRYLHSLECLEEDLSARFRTKFVCAPTAFLNFYRRLFLAHYYGSKHFQSCGTVNRVTILTDKFGQPKGFAYVEFVELEAIQNALLLNESELHGRQLKVATKRNNVPGLKQFRGRPANPYFAF